jgi:DDE superfamily endonuclease
MIRLKGKKKNRERLTIALCANASGNDKLKPLVIGKFLNPCCFKNINRKNLGVVYEANTKAWMTGIIFE